MTTIETDAKLWNDPLWVAIQECIERLEDEPRKVLFEKKVDSEEGLDSDTINELSDRPIFTFAADDDARTVRVHHPDRPLSTCVSWVTWHRLGLRDGLVESKLVRTIEYLRAWQERRKGELVAAAESTGTHRAETTKVDLTAYVPMAVLWPERFPRADNCTRFLNATTEIRQDKPSKYRRLVHAADWHNYWKKKDEEQSVLLNDDALQAKLADVEARTKEERERKKRQI